MKLTKIHSDERGSIYTLTDDNCREITVFKTNKGFARGGCIHKLNDEHFCVIKGKVLLTYGNKTKELSLYTETIKIKKNTPHYFISLTNSVVMEYGATKREKSVKHKLFRAKVDQINDTAN